MHRFTWDLRYPGPSGASGFGGGGPMVVPGTYQVRLTAGAWSQTHSVDVLMDPRVAADGVMQADLEAQLAFNLDVRDAMSDAQHASSMVDSLREKLDAEEGTSEATEALRETLERTKALLETKQGMSYPTPMLRAQLRYLYGMTSRADQRPGRDAYERLDALRSELDAIVDEVNEVEQAVNRLQLGTENR